MRKFSIEAIARQQLAAAPEAVAARAAATVVGGHEHVLRQTVLAMAAGAPPSPGTPNRAGPAMTLVRHA